jgi:hypothetical protein
VPGKHSTAPYWLCRPTPARMANGFMKGIFESRAKVGFSVCDDNHGG